jgi:hypothetical protein
MSEPAFVGAGASEGIELWRIEDFKPVKLPVVDGKFYQGDSYILLKSTKNPKTNSLSYAIHFWLGSQTSQDEAGAAAYKSVELDDSLGGGPIQYREVEGFESELFLSYFRTGAGIQYLPGGVQSGFRHVEKDSYATRLLHLKGKRTVRVREVPLTRSSINKGDVFILDTGLKIFIFNGPLANKFEKAKGIEVASHINIDERSGRAAIIIVDDDIQCPEFWEPLGGFVDPNSLPDVVDEKESSVAKVSPKLFKISDASGSVSFDEIPLPSGKLTKTLLNSGDVFLVHTQSKIYLWIGNGASLSEKREATSRAVQYIKQSGLPPTTNVERVSDGVETASFKSCFAAWTAPIAFGMQIKASASAPADPSVDVNELLARKAAEDAPVDDGSGKIEIWVVNDFKLVEVSPARYGQFYGGDSYVIKYTYTKNRREEYLIYFWLGIDSDET